MGNPVPYSLARIPKQGETRGNSGRRRHRRSPTAVGARPRNRTCAGTGTEGSGSDARRLDVIGDYLTEVNVTSPTCMREIADQTGFNVAA